VAERVGRGLPFEGSPVVARARRLPAAVWFVLLVALGLLAAVVVAVVGHTNNPLDAEVRNFQVDSPARITVSYQVTKSPLSTSRCQLQAVDVDHDVVGTSDDTVGPTQHNQKTTIRSVTITTSQPAVSAQMGSCSLLHTS
jgi:hypothetical protein